MCSDDTTVRIPLRARDGSVRAYALVDADTVEWVNQYRWSLNKKTATNWYAYRMEWNGGDQFGVYLHRVVMGLKRGDKTEIDHIDRDTLHNCRANLRPMPHSGQLQNTTPRGRGSSQYRGVFWCNQKMKWAAKCQIAGVIKNLGFFTDEHEAGQAAKAYRLRHMPYATD